MPFDFVWGMIENLGTPPNSIDLKNIKNGYEFYLLNHNGFIYTADSSIWRNETVAKIHYWPSVQNITEIILNRRLGNTILIVFSDKQMENTIDPGNSVELSKIPVDIESYYMSEFVDMGFDVIDISGISAIANIDYSVQELAMTQSEIQTTQYGLIASAAEAYKFADFATSTTSEHATFFPVKTKSIMSELGLAQ